MNQYDDEVVLKPKKKKEKIDDSAIKKESVDKDYSKDQYNDELLGVLNKGDQDARIKAIRGLGYRGDRESLEQIVRCFSDNDRKIQLEAFSVITTAGESAINPLLNALDSEKQFSRIWAIKALAKINNPRVIEHLILLTKDEDSEIRANATWALGMIGDDKVIEPLIQASKDKESNVRTWAMWGLGEIGNVTALKTLKKASRDNDEKVRKTAQEAIEKINEVNKLEGKYEEGIIKSKKKKEIVSDVDKKTVAKIEETEDVKEQTSLELEEEIFTKKATKSGIYMVAIGAAILLIQNLMMIIIGIFLWGSMGSENSNTPALLDFPGIFYIDIIGMAIISLGLFVWSFTFFQGKRSFKDTKGEIPKKIPWYGIGAGLCGIWWIGISYFWRLYYPNIISNEDYPTLWTSTLLSGEETDVSTLSLIPDIQYIHLMWILSSISFLVLTFFLVKFYSGIKEFTNKDRISGPSSIVVFALVNLFGVLLIYGAISNDYDFQNAENQSLFMIFFLKGAIVPLFGIIGFWSLTKNTFGIYNPKLVPEPKQSIKPSPTPSDRSYRGATSNKNQEPKPIPKYSYPQQAYGQTPYYQYANHQQRPQQANYSQYAPVQPPNYPSTSTSQDGFYKSVVKSSDKPDKKLSHQSKTCHKCGFAVESGWIRCPQCRAPLNLKCSNCGYDVKPDWNACPSCGEDLPT